MTVINSNKNEEQNLTRSGQANSVPDGSVQTFGVQTGLFGTQQFSGCDVPGFGPETVRTQKSNKFKS